MTENAEIDYTLNNPDTLTKYKTAAQISHKVLALVTELCIESAKVVEICQKGDQLLTEEVAKVYKGKKVSKGIAHPTTISPNSYVTPYTPLLSDTEEASTTIQPGEVIKIQLGAQIDGFGTIVCDSIIVPSEKNKGGTIPARQADLLLATYWANELFLRLMLPPGILASGTEEEKKKASAQKPPTQAKISQLLEKVAKSYDVNVVQNTTTWLFERNDIEAKKKIIVAPGEGYKGEGLPEVGEVWGVEVGMSLGSGKVKDFPQRATLHRRTNTTYGLKMSSSRQTLSEIVKKFGTFPFSLRQLDDERAGKMGVIECVRSHVLREYKPAGDADGGAVGRLFTTVAITKNGMVRLAAPPAPDLSQFKTDKKITDEEILEILERPIAKSTGAKSKNKKKKKKPAKKTTDEEEGESNAGVRWTVAVSLPSISADGFCPPTFRGQHAGSQRLDPLLHPNKADQLCSIAVNGLVVVTFTPGGHRRPRMASLRSLRNSSRFSSPNVTQSGSRESRDNRDNKDNHLVGVNNYGSTSNSPKGVKSEAAGNHTIAHHRRPSPSEPWEEPPLRTPAASFEDIPGLDRQGVLEHMAPLGSVPTQKLLQKLKLVPSKPNNRFSSPVPAAPSSQNPQEDDSVVAPTNGYNSVDTHSPLDLSPRSDSFRPEETMMTRSSSARGKAAPTDAEYKPPASAAPARSSPSKSRKASTSTTLAMPPASSGKSGNPGSTSSPSPSIQDIKTHFSLDVIKANGSLAIQLAEEHDQPGHAKGLRDFVNDSQKDPVVLLAMDAIFRQSADRAQIRLLRRYMRAGAATLGLKLNPKEPKATRSRSPQPTSTYPAPNAVPGSRTSSAHRRQNVQLEHETTRRTTPSRNNSTKSSESSTVVVGATQSTSNRREQSLERGTVGDEETVKERLEVPRTRHRRSRSASESSLSSAQSLENPLSDNPHGDAAEGSRTGAKAGPGSGRRQAPNRQVPIPASSLPSLPPHHRQPVSPSSKPNPFANWPILNKNPNARRSGNNKRSVALTPEEEAELQDKRKRLSDDTFEHRPNGEAENTADLREKFSLTIDERTPLDLDHLKAINRSSPVEAPPRSPVIHRLSVYSSEQADNHSSPVESTFSPTIAPSPTFPTFPNLRNGANKKRTRNDLEDEEEAETPTSSGPGDFLMPPAAGHGSSRAGTPRITGRPAKKIKKSARVMVSPQKNKTGGVTAGTARSRGGDHSTANGADSDEEKNNDFCSACGGNGQLLCCDGCPNSFHFTCLDPPMNPKQPPEGEWLCATCRARHHRQEPQSRGFFGRLLNNVDDANPKAYAMSSYIRNYFEGVKTGEEGEYQDVVVNRQNNEPFRMNRMGAPEEPDYKKLRDKDGHVLTCHTCGRSTDNGKRELIPCDYCPARFHTDCLDPPLAVPPRRRPGDKPNGTWRCPLHTDPMVQNIHQDRSPEYIAALADGERLISRKPKLRRPKNAVPIDVELERGTRNNGLVDIDLMPEAEDNFRDIDMGGEIYRIPEKGLRLDFIDKVKRSRMEDRVLPSEALRAKRLRGNLYRPTNQQVQPLVQQADQISRMNRVASRHALEKTKIEENDRAQAKFEKRDLREQQAILALQGMAQDPLMASDTNGNEIVVTAVAPSGKKRDATEAGIHDDAEEPSRKAAKRALNQLYNGLVGEMTDEVLELFESDERGALQAAMKIMAQRLKALDERARRTKGDSSTAVNDSNNAPSSRGGEPATELREVEAVESQGKQGPWPTLSEMVTGNVDGEATTDQNANGVDSAASANVDADGESRELS